jgi:hypothetical protein
MRLKDRRKGLENRSPEPKGKRVSYLVTDRVFPGTWNLFLVRTDRQT